MVEAFWFVTESKSSTSFVIIFLVAEDGVTNYVAEDGVTQYILG